MLMDERDDLTLHLHPDTTLVAYAFEHVLILVEEPA
jgi:hypothetical protein